jgi:hypothetical protein
VAHPRHADPRRRTLGSESCDSVPAWILWLTIAISVSPLPAAISGIGGNLFYLAGCLVFLGCHFALGRRYRISKAAFGLLPVVATLPSVIYWTDPGLALFPIYVVSAVIVLVAATDGVLIRFCNVMSISMLWIVIGAWIGFGYAFAGGPSHFSIINPDQRVNDFFLTTFSNWSVGNLIRPAGIFDEPGALSFLLCLCAALRSRMNMPRRTTWALLLLGLVTTSIAHVIYMAFHAIMDRAAFKKYSKQLMIAAALAVVAIAQVDLPDTTESEVFLSRFAVEDGKLGGDTRSNLFSAALEQIDVEVFLFGLDSDCVLRPDICNTRRYGQFGETPAGMILLLGIFLALPYFVVLGAAMYRSFRERNLALLAISLLLLQRPYVSTFGYSLLILIVVFARTARAPDPQREMGSQMLPQLNRHQALPS